METFPATPAIRTVRTQLRVLEEKGHVRTSGRPALHLQPAVRAHCSAFALKHLVESFTRVGRAGRRRASRRRIAPVEEQLDRIED